MSYTCSQQTLGNFRGLLRNSFRPSRGVRTLRTYWRQRQDLVQAAGEHVQRMQKALTQMNLQLANVISDISGLTGQTIIKAILNGERDPRQLAAYRDRRVQANEEEIARSLEGNWQDDLLFVLRQEQESYEFWRSCRHIHWTRLQFARSKWRSAIVSWSNISNKWRIGAKGQVCRRRSGNVGLGKRPGRMLPGSMCARCCFA